MLACGFACKPQLQSERAASLRYRDAWDRRAAGDEAGSQVVLREIVAKWPETRAGHRATEILSAPTSGTGSPAGAMMTTAVAGVMAAVAVPAFMKYRARVAATAEATAEAPTPPRAGAPRRGRDPITPSGPKR
jgi:hypothetical protein